MSADFSRKQNWLCQACLSVLLAAVILGGYFLCVSHRFGLAYWIALLLCLFLFPGTGLARDIAPVLRAWWGMGRAQTRRLFLLAGGSTAVCSFIAHGFLFANEFFSHDSVVHMDIGAEGLMGAFTYFTSLGRFILRPYEGLRGHTTYAPWLVGMLFILWMTLFTVLLVRLLDIQSAWGVLFSGGLACTSTFAACTGATFFYCLDEYALSLALAAAAVFFFQRRCTLPGVACMTVSMGLYQAYFCTALTLAFFCVIRQIYEKRDPLEVIRQGLRYLASLFLSFCAYYAVWTALCAALRLDKGRVGETALGGGLLGLLKSIKDAWPGYFTRYLLDSGKILGALHLAASILLLLAAVLWALGYCRDKAAPRACKALLLLCFLLMPLALNVTAVLFVYASDLMSFQTCLFFVFLVFCREHPTAPRLASRRYGAAVLALLCVICWQNVIFSNQAYLRKEVLKTSSLSLVTRIISRVETVEGYQPNQTTVLFWPDGYISGLSNLVRDTSPYPFKELAPYVGLGVGLSPTTTSYLCEYINVYLNYPMVLTWQAGGLTDAEREQIQAMPLFPAAGSVAFVGSRVVVKLG